MSSDKNLKDLGKFLKVLQQPIRREILKKLNLDNNPISFSALQKEILGIYSNSVNFSFHLKSLKNLSLVSSKEEGYFITNLGRKILNFIINMELVLNENQKPIMIRTSKYSKEKFNLKKIEEYLIKEGKLESNIAENIAEQVRKRLSTTKINYLTAPLMREYINGILLENDLEEVRHRLTRLGTPPSDVKIYFKDKKITPVDFINILGSDVSEQYLLLNLLPKKIADLYLSGEILLLHLNHWALRPLSIYLHTETVLKELFDKNPDLPSNFKDIRDLVSLSLKFTDYLKKFRPFFSEDILLNEFNSKFLTYFCGLEEENLNFMHKILASRLLDYNDFFRDKKSHISLEFNYIDDEHINNEKSSLFQIDKTFLQQFNNKKSLNGRYQIPLILLDYYNIYKSKSFNSGFEELFSLFNLKNIIFYDQNSSNLLNSTMIKVKTKEFNENRIILDKILINLYSIAREANQNDDLFYNLIQEKLKYVFELFDWKVTLISKKLQNSSDWKNIINRILKKNINNWMNEALKSISFIGLNEAIIHHCGLELDRTEKSESFALSILSFLKSIIKEKNESENNYYLLTQPHNFNFINSINNSILPKSNKTNIKNPLKIIRNDSNLPLDKKITLFKKFEKIIDGGNQFTYISRGEEFLNRENLKFLIESNLQAFKIHY